ncbi:MAG: hypothetical protein FJ128_13595 [Deltaproteobacteria bacterium]|nr:hypothetical protein [Deltaproteobacteria bacterium]
MTRYFNFYDPLERRYLFNSFLVVVAVVEVLIFLVTLIWQMDEGIFTDQVKVVPFPWKEYLLVAFTAPIALVFLFGVIVRGFQALAPPGPEGEKGEEQPLFWGRLRLRTRLFLALAGILTVLGLLVAGGPLLTGVTRLFKALGLWGTYLFAALVVLLCFYVPLRLLLNYRLKKRELDYRYLVYLAERHGVVISDPKKRAALSSSMTSNPSEDSQEAAPPSSLPAPDEEAPR